MAYRGAASAGGFTHDVQNPMDNNNGNTAGSNDSPQYRHTQPHHQHHYSYPSNDLPGSASLTGSFNFQLQPPPRGQTPNGANGGGGGSPYRGHPHPSSSYHQQQQQQHSHLHTPGGTTIQHSQAISAHTRAQLENHMQNRAFSFNSSLPASGDSPQSVASNASTTGAGTSSHPSKLHPQSNNNASSSTITSSGSNLGPNTGTTNNPTSTSSSTPADRPTPLNANPLVAADSGGFVQNGSRTGGGGGGAGSTSSAAAVAAAAAKAANDGGMDTPGEGPSGSTGGTAGGGGATATAAAAGKGRQPGGASDFVKKLYKMLEDESYKNIVTWGTKGDSFVVKDMNEFTKIVLPQHFKHSNFASFVRQLNKYDFHKVKNPEGQGDAATGENYWEFKHPSFSTDQKHSLENIRRKITTSKKPETPGVSGGPNGPILGGAGQAEDIALLTRQINVLTHNQKQIEAHMDRFTAQYHALVADLVGQHDAIAAQDAFTATTLQYIFNLESRLLQLTNPADSPAFPPSQEAQHLMAAYSELSRARYDKMTEAARRAEALGMFVKDGFSANSSVLAYDMITNPNSSTNNVRNHLVMDSPADDNASSPDFSRPPPPPPPPPHNASGSAMSTGVPTYLPPPLPPLQHQQQQAMSPLNHPLTPLHHHPQHPSHLQHQVQTPSSLHHSTQGNTYFRQPLGSPGPPVGPIEGSSNSNSNASNSFSNLGEIRLGGGGVGVGPSNATAPNNLLMPNSQQQRPAHDNGPMESYFPTPGSAPIRPSIALTPGAVMVSTLNVQNSRHASESDGGEYTPDTANHALTAANTESNRVLLDPSTLTPESENLAALAAALKGGQPPGQVRAALTSQPILVRRATYIPGWSVAPRVLLVEDDAVTRNLTTKFLQIFGCTIDVAADGVEAVQKMQTGVYDICMMDISMPNLDGVSATSLIRQFDAMTPIISMTGNSRPDEVLTYFSHGMNDVLPKPFTKEGILSMLEKHLIHLKQIHKNPEIVPDTSMLDNFDPNNFDFSNGNNPFYGLGVSDEDYQSIMNSNMKFSLTTPSPTTTGTGNTNAGTSGAGIRTSSTSINDTTQQDRHGRQIQGRSTTASPSNPSGTESPNQNKSDGSGSGSGTAAHRPQLGKRHTDAGPEGHNKDGPKRTRFREL